MSRIYYEFCCGLADDSGYLIPEDRYPKRRSKREKRQRRRRASETENTENESHTAEMEGTVPLFETAQMAAATGGKIKVNLHVFSDLNGWEKRRKDNKSPLVELNVSVNTDDYKFFGRKLDKLPHGGPTEAVADTGCTATLIGLKRAYSLGFKKKDFIPVDLKMRAINESPVEIIGAILLRISAHDKNGTLVTTT